MANSIHISEVVAGVTCVKDNITDLTKKIEILEQEQTKLENDISTDHGEILKLREKTLDFVDTNYMKEYITTMIDIEKGETRNREVKQCRKAIAYSLSVLKFYIISIISLSAVISCIFFAESKKYGIVSLILLSYGLLLAANHMIFEYIKKDIISVAISDNDVEDLL